MANEIKEMGRQTAADIAAISPVIMDINNSISGIATAVEEQSAATAEISKNIAQARWESPR